MTINELIEKLKEYGDEKARDMGVVRIVNRDGGVVEDQINVFDVKFSSRGVDIPSDIYQTFEKSSDDEDYWDDDEYPWNEDEDEDEDEEDYGWGDDEEPKKP